MKILRITLRNIASLAGKHTVDFTREPLRSAGLFSISGATGSGKSTLLDALCLALYDDTPRLRKVGRLVELEGERQNDPRNLLRRGCGEGSAEVAFVGVDRAIYTARWSVRRAHSRPDGALQHTEMTLFRGDVTGPSGAVEQGGNKSEVKAAVAAKVGLSFEQFTRAVLLAQNDFATFLKADDRERAEILQALTGTERFEQISITVFARCGAEQQAVAEIESRLAGNAPLSPEDRAKAAAAVAEAEAAWNGAHMKVTELEADSKWFERLAELARQTQSAADALREKAKARDEAAPRRAELHITEELSREARSLRERELRLHHELADAQKLHEVAVKDEAAAQAAHAAARQRHGLAATAAEAEKSALERVKPGLLQARELDAKLVLLAERFAAATRDREAAETNAKQLTERRDELRKTRDAAQRKRTPLVAKRDGLVAIARFAPDAAAWLHRFDNAAACRRTLEDATGELRRRAEAERATADAMIAERSRESEIRKAAADATAAFSKADDAAKAHDGEKVARVRTEADAARTALRELEKHLHEIRTLSDQAAAIEAEVARLQREREADASKLADLQAKQIPDAERAADAARTACELAEAAVADEGVRLREKLVPGQPCSVCGATEHPYAAQPPAHEAAALRALRADCARKETAARKLRETAAGLDAACKTRVAHETDQRTALSAARARIDTLRAVRHEHAVAKAVFALPESEQAPALAAQLAAQQQALDAADAADRARRAAEKSRDAARNKRDAAAAEVEKLERQLAKLAEQLAAARAAHEGAASAHARAEKSWHACVEELAPILDGLSGARAAWDRDAAAFRKQFAEETEEFSALEKRVAELNSMIRDGDTALGPASDALALAEQERTKRQTDEQQARSAHDDLRKLRARLFDGRPADSVESELAAALERATGARDQFAGELGNAGTRLTAAVEALKSAAKAHADCTTRHTGGVAALDAWLAAFCARIGRAFTRTELDAALLRDDAWIKAERAALDAMEGAVREASGALAVHQKSLDAHAAHRPATAEPALAAALAESRHVRALAEQRRDEARAILLADEQQIAANAALSQQLAARRAQAEPWAKLNELIGSADGAKFRAIAQRRTLDILLGYANAQLEQLAPRYRLERLPESLNLIVIDRDMGDERRSVHSLSGGESFLVSLALALALASLTSNRLRIESLFIDEGFGSLDPETLNTAMNALMHLEAQGRKVGVISHVAEMTDAIPVQIRVVKGRGGAARLIVPGVAAPECAEPVRDRDDRASEATAGIAERILAILRREHAAGLVKVSVRALRSEIGCGIEEFQAARESLAGQVIADGRSLALA